MKKVSFFLASLNKGGLERVSSLIANYLTENYIVTMYIFSDEKIEYDIDNRINIVSLVKYSKRKIKLLRWVKKALKENTDIAIVMGANLSLLVLVANLFIKKAVIISERSNPKSSRRNFIVWKLQNFFFKKARRVVFQSEDVKKMYNKKVQQKGIIIENPVIRNLPKASLESLKIVTAGRLSSQKNHELLIKAFEKIEEKHPGYKLDIYGKGELEKRLKQLILSSGLQEKIFLKGNSDNLHEEIKDASIFVMPSKFEGLSNALIEAYTMGIPCIGSDVIGIKNIIKHKKTGLLFESENLDDLVNVLTFAIENPSKMVEYRENAIKDSRRFDHDTIIKEWEKLLEEHLY